MNKKLMVLSIQTAINLGNEIYKIHQDLESWRDPGYGPKQRTDLSLKIKYAPEEQYEWLAAVQQELENEDED